MLTTPDAGHATLLCRRNCLYQLSLCSVGTLDVSVWPEDEEEPPEALQPATNRHTNAVSQMLLFRFIP